MSTAKAFPVKGMSWEEVKRSMEELKGKDLDEKHQRLLIQCHMGEERVNKVCREAFNMYFHHNAMVGEYEDGQKQMMNEIIAMALELLHGGEEARGHFTTGGTESIMCAMHTAREWAKLNHPEIKTPYEIIIPWTAHAAFDKSANYLGMTLKRVPVTPEWTADVAAMEKAITPHTLVMVGSSPCWGLGLIDPIPAIAEVARRHNLWMHSDCCVGGYLLPWIERLGYYTIPPYDFRVPGVCSISADLHKHGYAAKPCSTVLYRSADLEQFHGVGVDDWQSGHYKTQGVVGSRPFASTASAWAVMKFLGEEGYIDLTRRALEVKERLIKGIEATGDYKVMRNQSLLVPVYSETLDMLKVFGGFIEKGYFPFGTITPLCIHFSAEPCSDEIIDMYINDLKDIAHGIKEGRITEQAIAKYI